MVSETKLASAMSGKTARACDNCLTTRARWYCPSDDAFLCQSCDSSVHRANPLARRHQRVRLKAASLSPLRPTTPSWHRGFARKARTPRHGKHANKASKGEPVTITPLHCHVPEDCSEENSHEENELEDQLLYRVPVFDPFSAQLCNSNDEEMSTSLAVADCPHEPGNDAKDVLDETTTSYDTTRFHSMDLPSELELAEFAADVESLLGKALDDESQSLHMEGIGLMEYKETFEQCYDFLTSSDHERVKIEDDEVEVVAGDPEIEPFELKFKDFGSEAVIGSEDNIEDCEPKKRTLLKLDYLGVMKAWPDQTSPWTTGERPRVDSDCWPHCMGRCGGNIHACGEQTATVGGQYSAAMMDGGREARVSRYREKRRTRLFSKKIRYEVRKLNAEKRPRMKGRFVKRANFLASFSSDQY